jgi:hypothetical protein
MADQADETIEQLRAEILALQVAAAAETLAVAQATADAAQAATDATQAAVLQATNAAAGQPGAAAVPPVPQGAAVPPVPQAATGPLFTLAPALANTATFLDLTSSSGAKHFKGAIESLNSHPFDFEDGADLQVFLDLVLTKSQVWGWNNIFNIPVKDPKTGVIATWHLLNHYGMIPIASVRDHAMTYYADHSKQAQDSFMLCQCLLSSLGLDFLKTITADTSAYHLPPIVIADGLIPSGPLLLKLIISRAHVDTRATVSFLRTSLTVLDEKMIELDSNVVAFNAYVKAQVKALNQRNQTTSDLLINLIKGYKKAEDVEFQDLIRRMINDYEEGKDVTINSLMDATDNKYRTRKLNKEWAAPTKEQEQIVALTAQVQHLKSAQTPKQVRKEAKKNKKDKDHKWAWKDVQPKEGEPTTKLFEGKQYHVNCPYHKGKWVCHTIDECFQNPANASPSSGPPSSEVRASTPAARRLQRTQLAAALLEDDEELEEEENDNDSTI